jgi:hypothetical protein
VAAINLLNLNFGLGGRTWLNWRPDDALRWKVEDHRLERSKRVMWQVGTTKAVAPACVG